MFAKERTEESIKEALFEGRTVTWFDDILAGESSNMQLLLDSCLIFKNKDYIGDSEVLEIEIQNRSDANFYLKNVSVYDFCANTDVIHVKPQSTKKLQVITTRNKGQKLPLAFEVLNAVIGYKKNHKIIWTLE